MVFKCKEDYLKKKAALISLKKIYTGRIFYQEKRQQFAQQISTGGFLFTAAHVFAITQVVKRGIELQSETN